MKALLIAVLSANVLLAGCGNMQNLTADDVRVPENLRAQVSIPKSIQELDAALAANAQRCGPSARLTVNPADPSEAYYIASMPGLSKASVALIIDVKQRGATSTVRGYTYYRTWSDQITAIVATMQDPTTCH